MKVENDKKVMFFENYMRASSKVATLPLVCLRHFFIVRPHSAVESSWRCPIQLSDPSLQSAVDKSGGLLSVYANQIN